MKKIMNCKHIVQNSIKILFFNRMSIEDFCRYYADLDICGVSPDFLDGTSSKWKTSMHEGRWVAGTTAGG